jgi:hypothetical protein
LIESEELKLKNIHPTAASNQHEESSSGNERRNAEEKNARE